MSVTMSKAGGVTVFTLTSDPDSPWPPLCQILKSLCYSPVCCSVSQQLRKVQKTSLSVLGAIHMMIGLLNIGLGTILLQSHSGPLYIFESSFPFWMGSLFIVFGILCILSERYPSRCLIILNVITNLAGAAFAIAAVVLYSMYVAQMFLWLCCDKGSHYWSYGVTTPVPASDSAYFKEACLEGKALVKMLLRGIVGVLIVLSVMELCVTISSAVLGIKALRRTNKGKNETYDDPEIYKPMLEEDTTEPAA